MIRNFQQNQWSNHLENSSEDPQILIYQDY